jgi:hypothetical protein
MEGYFLTGQSPQWAVVPMGEEDIPNRDANNGYRNMIIEHFLEF